MGEDIADVRKGAARDPKLFFVSSSSTTSTISTSTLCYSTINSAATTCPGRKKKRAIMEAIDHDTPVEADKVSSLESGMEEVESANQRQGKFLLYWLTTTRPAPPPHSQPLQPLFCRACQLDLVSV